ncbi:MAG TPA: hypothetical protein VFE16_05420 [Candidatus Cybelea sp.]|jgi:hypothetical protein|nr:hypothetical protein [Candidatus Cybelea sp.]
MRLFLIIVVVVAIAWMAQASAATFYRYESPATAGPKTVAGIVSDTGQIEEGSGFSVSHLTTGEYNIRFEKGFFPTGCGAMLVQTWGRAPVIHQLNVLGSARALDCQVHNPYFHVVLRATDGTLRDDHFQFIAVGT